VAYEHIELLNLFWLKDLAMGWLPDTVIADSLLCNDVRGNISYGSSDGFMCWAAIAQSDLLSVELPSISHGPSLFGFLQFCH
jgi:hypothetical protein